MSDLDQSLERLYSNERLTDNLTDSAAQTLLKWAEERLRGGAAPAAVFDAMRAVNRTGASDPALISASAQAALLQQLAGQADAAGPSTPSASAQPPPPVSALAPAPLAARAADGVTTRSRLTRPRRRNWIIFRWQHKE